MTEPSVAELLASAEREARAAGGWKHTPHGLALRAHYFSTHCLHDHHDQCKGTCKHCPEACRCDCHGEAA